MGGRPILQRVARQALSLALLGLAWHLAALVVADRTLPSPVVVAGVMATALTQGDLAPHLGITLARVAASFLVALCVGVALGVAMGRHRRLDSLLDGWLVFFLNLPALVTAILCYVWFGLTELAALLAVAVNKIPGMVVTLREGARTLNPQFQDLAHIYRFGWGTRLRHVVLPQLAPYLLVAARSGLATSWKIVLVVEMLGRSDGIGFKLHVFFQLFDVAGILAYSLAFIAVIQAIELAVLVPAERRSLAWRAP